MLWLTTANATINKGTKERLLGHLKKMLRFGVGEGVGGDDVEKVLRTSGKILATPLRVWFRNGEKRWFLYPRAQ